MRILTYRHTHTQTTHFTNYILLPVLDSVAHLLPPALTAPLTTLDLTTLPASCIYFKIIQSSRLEKTKDHQIQSFPQELGCEDWMAPGTRLAAHSLVQIQLLAPRMEDSVYIEVQSTSC